MFPRLSNTTTSEISYTRLEDKTIISLSRKLKTQLVFTAACKHGAKNKKGLNEASFGPG